MAIYYPGTLFLVVGNSGSGKDSIISEVINEYPKHLKRIFRAKRYITRDPSENEENYNVSHEDFMEMLERGNFALKWHIYGLDYGIHIEIEEWLKKGHPVIVNVSRTIINKAREQYQNVRVIFIKVPIEITVKRIKIRGRETEDLLEERIERARKHQTFPEADFMLENSGDLKDAVKYFLNYLLEIIKE